MVQISEISFKNRKNCTYLNDLDHEKTTTLTTGYLKKTQDGLQILAVRGFRNRSKKFLKNSLKGLQSPKNRRNCGIGQMFQRQKL